MNAFKLDIIKKLDAAVIKYNCMAENGKIGVGNQFAPSDCEEAVEIAAGMSELAWDNLENLIGDAVVEGWNLALYVQKYKPCESREDRNDSLQSFLDSQYI